MGAGDVKLLAAAGSFLGPYGALVGGLSTLLAGGVLAIAMFLGRRFEDWRAARLCLPKTLDPKASHLPYSLAISAGVLLAVLR
jgi:prepilin peptidase CpaA